MRWMWRQRRWIFGLIVRVAIVGGFEAWRRYGWQLDDVRFDLDWFVWCGAALAGYLLIWYARAPWRRAVTHETKLRWYHKLIMRIPVVETVILQMAKMAQRLGVAGGIKNAYANAFERGMNTRGSHKRRHIKQIDKGVDAAVVATLKEMGIG